ncbi:MAG: hypothetical protein HZC17_04970 [Candidatus Omnitrophica bacterium]|nr:hypothetical protein [Candidatus Omnitrophota bacterium]
MLTQEEITKLSRFERLDSPIVSFYLNLSPEMSWKKVQGVTLKDLMKEGREQIENLALSKQEKGLAIFSQRKNKRFFAYPLYQPLANQVVVDFDIYINPLVNLMGQYHRTCVVTVDQKRARICEFFMGQLEGLMDISDVIPKRVRTGGFMGYGSKNMERHVDEGVHRHLKNVAEKLFEIFKKNHFDDLILGGEKKILPEFESLLHSYLKERIVGHFQIDSEASLTDITAAAQKIEFENKNKRDAELVHQLQIATFKQGGGVIGLDGTLEAISRGHVHRLVVHEDLWRPGVECKPCGQLRVDGTQCPQCDKPLTSVRDIINQAVEHALHQKAEVWYVPPQIPIADGIGAFLRFRVGITELEAVDVKANKKAARRV